AGYTDARLQSAIDRLAARVFRQTGIIPMSPASPAVLRVECAAAGPDYPTLGENESYTLDVSTSGAVLKAPTVTGALRGMATFAQLIVPGADGFEIAAVHIEDRPRFLWRGLMLDVSRHWMPIEVVKRNLEAMAAVKLNVFHWHLSDDQGFRVESKVYPKLQGAGSDGNYYTQDQIRDVVAFARDRGIRVVPEFDVPGHTTSWLPGYPELASGPGPYEIGRHFGVFDPCLDPTKEWTYSFLDGFIGEMVKLFPDPYFHVGGDEVNGKQWKASGSIQSFAREHNLADDRALQVYFNQRLLKIVEKYGKIMVGWDEILHPDLPKTAVIQSWRGQKSLADAAAQGYRGILSWGYYLDHLSPASYHYGIDPLAGATAQLTPEQAERVLGGEACMWAELVSAETVDSRIWPRTAAIAERFWSAGDLKDLDSMYDRMAVISRELEWTGVEHRSDYGPMLDRLSGERAAAPLRVLADASEALGLGPRRGGRYTTQQPLHRFVDAARPESESVKALERAGARLAANPKADSTDAAKLTRAFHIWEANDREFQPMADGNALLTELKPLSRDLSELGTIGLKALEYLTGGKPAPADWVAEQTREIDRIRKPNAEVTLAAYRPVKLLLDAAESQ
ncbi:MAG TPA: family 20 glycosylhydrolase, partial [Candidatus Sulfopaludibacter sp.]|nr:family 20 glycosylhydrolase [Candidatus Sulfopaludibacter sp.]